MYTARLGACKTQPRMPSERSRKEQQLSQLRKLLRSRPATAEHSDQESATAWQRLTGTIGPRRLLDCLAATRGSGCGLIALDLCIQACRSRGELVVIDSDGSFHPPTAIAWGVDARRLIVVRPDSMNEAIAAAETSLRSPATGAVWAPLGSIDSRAFRRLLLATESGQAFGALIRSAHHALEPSWGDVQLLFTPVTDSSNKRPFLVRVTPDTQQARPRSRLDYTRNRLGNRANRTD